MIHTFWTKSNNLTGHFLRPAVERQHKQLKPAKAEDSDSFWLTSKHVLPPVSHLHEQHQSISSPLLHISVILAEMSLSLVPSIQKKQERRVVVHCFRLVFTALQVVNPCPPRASPATLLTPSNLFKVCNCNSLKTPTLVWSCGDLHVLYADIFAMEGLFRLQSQGVGTFFPTLVMLQQASV